MKLKTVKHSKYLNFGAQNPDFSFKKKGAKLGTFKKLNFDQKVGEICNQNLELMRDNLNISRLTSKIFVFSTKIQMANFHKDLNIEFFGPVRQCESINQLIQQGLISIKGKPVF